MAAEAPADCSGGGGAVSSDGAVHAAKRERESDSDSDPGAKRTKHDVANEKQEEKEEEEQGLFTFCCTTCDCGDESMQQFYAFGPKSNFHVGNRDLRLKIIQFLLKCKYYSSFDKSKSDTIKELRDPEINYCLFSDDSSFNLFGAKWVPMSALANGQMLATHFEWGKSDKNEIEFTHKYEDGITVLFTNEEEQAAANMLADEFERELGDE